MRMYFRTLFTKPALSCAAFSLAAAFTISACGSGTPAGGASPAEEESAASPAGGKADNAFQDRPLYMTGAFDGSKRFSGWVETLEFARYIEKQYGKRLRWSYFINTCYYDRNTQGSGIGTALSRDEEIVRWALTQQVLNEGHEVGNHSVRHMNGGKWSYEKWRAENEEFQALVEKNLFVPIANDEGGFVFPKWEPVASAGAGEVGAQCSSHADCKSGECLPVAANISFCTAPCNRHSACPTGTVCGAPDWNESTDRCVPKPSLPIEHNGKVLFDKDGKANLEHPDLQPYRMVGYRAPELGHNAGLYRNLTELGYEYDTSQVLPPGPPQKTKFGGETFDKLFQFALMKKPGAATIPMDFNYFSGKVSGERMLEDYKNGIIDAYQERNRQPWNIGHHFSQWMEGAYWEAMKGAFEFAAQGCPGEEGKLCPEIEFPTFAELASILRGISEDKADGPGEDIFLIDGDPAEEWTQPAGEHAEE